MDKDKTEEPLFCLKGEITFARDKKRWSLHHK